MEQQKSKETESGPPKARSKGPGAKRAEKRRKINDIASQEAELPGESGDPVVSSIYSQLRAVLCDVRIKAAVRRHQVWDLRTAVKG